MHFYHKNFVSIDIKGFSFQIFGSCFHSAVNFTNFTNHNSLNNFYRSEYNEYLLVGLKI